jgi:plastocyanin
VLGIYIVLVAATKLLPRALRFKRYKPWMRFELGLWWVVILIGVSTYYVWYLRPANVAAPKQAAVVESVVTPQKVSVKITNFQFEPKELSIKAGTIVEWTDERGRHTVEADDGSFKSDTLTAAGQFEHKFDTPGVYPYFCSFHGDKHGKDMAGVITVTP